MRIVKKTLNLDADKIEQVRRFFGLKTETETIHLALDKILLEAQAENSLRDLLKKGKFKLSES
jgi:Arc/MetJ family transcription regulator